MDRLAAIHSRWPMAAATLSALWTVSRAWPPYGVGQYDDDYDWPSMPDDITGNSPAVQIDAVAELCYEVGKAAGTDYGCSESTAWVGGKLVLQPHLR